MKIEMGFTSLGFWDATRAHAHFPRQNLTRQLRSKNHATIRKPLYIRNLINPPPGTAEGGVKKIDTFQVATAQQKNPV